MSQIWVTQAQIGPLPGEPIGGKSGFRASVNRRKRPDGSDWASTAIGKHWVVTVAIPGVFARVHSLVRPDRCHLDPANSNGILLRGRRKAVRSVKAIYVPIPRWSARSAASTTMTRPVVLGGMGWRNAESGVLAGGANLVPPAVRPEPWRLASTRPHFSSAICCGTAISLPGHFRRRKLILHDGFIRPAVTWRPLSCQAKTYRRWPGSCCEIRASDARGPFWTARGARRRIWLNRPIANGRQYCLPSSRLSPARLALSSVLSFS